MPNNWPAGFKGKPANQAPTGVPLLVAFEDKSGEQPPWFAVVKAENGQDRFCNPCLEWVLAYTGQRIDLSEPTRYWLPPGVRLPRFAMHATYATRTGRQGSRDVIRHGADLSSAVRDFSAYLERQGFSKIDVHGRPAAPMPGDPK